MSSRTEAPVYLKPSVKMELLACRWYAWSHLISPVTHAFNLAFRQMPALRSYLASPAVHEAASADPTALCGPFVQIPARRRDEVKALLDRTQQQHSHLVRFAEELRTFSAGLRRHAVGQALDDQYSRLPNSLAGLAELTYDTSDRASVCLIEELAEDLLDNTSSQELSFFEDSDESRPFFLNTPRLADAGRVDLAIPFADARVDVLASLRTQAADFDDVTARLGLDPAIRGSFRELFTHDAPLRDTPNHLAGSGLRVRFFGHACVLVEGGGVSVLFDPVVAWERGPDAALTFADLPDRIDWVVLTHNHQDHFCPEVLVQLRRRIGTIVVPRNGPGSIVDPSMKLALRRLGFAAIVEAAPLTRIDMGVGALTTIPFMGEHAGLNIQSKQGALLEMCGRRMLFVADSDCCDRALYRRLASHCGNIDVLFIGMECEGAPLSWLYGPYLTDPVTRRIDESRRLSGSNCDRAWAVVEETGCRRVFVYAMGQERWLRHLLGLEYQPDSVQIQESDRLVERCRAQGIPAERLKGCREIAV